MSFELVSRDTDDDIDWLEDEASGLGFLLDIALTNAVRENPKKSYHSKNQIFSNTLYYRLNRHTNELNLCIIE